MQVRVLGLVALLLASAPRASAEPVAAAWARVRLPVGGSAEAIGSTSNGCLRGGEALPAKGPGFRLRDPRSKKRFGHPETVAMVRDLGRAVRERKLEPAVVADLGQPRGGPSPTGHASHQTGLDVDIWYLTRERKVSDRSSKAVLARVRSLLEIAARDPRVDRIFVNPRIKKAMCSWPTRAPWLKKLRPWWGHDEHFHVRLHCPVSSPSCEPQKPLGLGDGCLELDWWFDDKAQAERKKEQKAYRSRIGDDEALPAACAAVLAGSL